MELIPEILSLSPSLSIVIITAHATFDTAVEAVQRGARDYLPKPFSPAQVRHIVEQTMDRRALTSRVVALENRLAEEAPEIDLVSESPVIRSIIEALTRAARTDVTVLLRGESGTGKGVFAHMVHERSERRDRPFVT